MTLTPVQTIELLVGKLPTSGSDGKLLVYEMVLFGRLAADAHAVQKKNEFNCAQFGRVGLRVPLDRIVLVAVRKYVGVMF